MWKEGQVRIPSGCAIAGIVDLEGNRFSGEDIIRSIACMHDRSNGLGGGFAAYGIYPQYKNYIALHVFYQDDGCRRTCEDFLERHFELVNLSRIPTRPHKNITDVPLIWRYFVTPLHSKLSESQLDEDTFTARCVTRINSQMEGCYVFSSGRNMGVFKGVGYPEDLGRFYRLEEYEGYAFTAHGRYPTNTPGWWGGAHPFALLEHSVVHNGEISSYDANRRTMEMYGYRCTLQTDTEVIAYILDYLRRRQRLTYPEIAGVLAAPFWSTIAAMEPEQQDLYTYLRHTFPSLLLTGPFSILVGFQGGLMALNDRLKLRSMVVGHQGSRAYVASEECAIRAICPSLDSIYAPKGGEPVLLTVKEEFRHVL